MRTGLTLQKCPHNYRLKMKLKLKNTHKHQWLSPSVNPIKGLILQPVYILLLCVTVGTRTHYLTIFTSKDRKVFKSSRAGDTFQFPPCFSGITVSSVLKIHHVYLHVCSSPLALLNPHTLPRPPLFSLPQSVWTHFSVERLIHTENQVFFKLLILQPRLHFTI